MDTLIHCEFIYESIPTIDPDSFTYDTQSNQFYLNIPGVAKFLALPEKNCIVIEKADPEIDEQILNIWLMGTMISYMLQYHGYTVLHGSSTLINEGAVIFSGQSGAGKSTLARAMLQQGYPFITDDLVVIKQNQQGQYCILPGPATLRLWKDAMQHFNHDIHEALPVMLKTDKYVVPVKTVCHETMIPISTFYELNVSSQIDGFHCDKLNQAQSLKTLMQNAYRYFMLKPLGKLQTFFHDCSGLSQQITVHKMTRSTCFDELPQIIRRIELDHGVAL